MPYSDDTMDLLIKKFIAKQIFNKAVDIGPGAGKYGKMIREINPNTNITAIEVDKSYIHRYKLKKIYNKVYHAKAEVFFYKNPNFTSDIAIIGDCIEHLKKSDGTDLLNFLVYRTRMIICVFPSKYVQYPWEGHNNEAHISIWSKLDFKGFDYTFKKRGYMNLAIIKGYIEDKTSNYPKMKK